MKKKLIASRRERGQSLLELALGMTFLLALLAGVVDMGRAFLTYVALRDAAQEGALYGSIDPRRCDLIENRVRLSSHQPVDLTDTTNVSVTIQIAKPGGALVSCAAATNVCMGDELRVSVKFQDFPMTMPLIGMMIGSQEVDISTGVSDTILSPPCTGG